MSNLFISYNLKKMREIKFRAWDKSRKVMIGIDYPNNRDGSIANNDERYGNIDYIRLTAITNISKDERFVIMQYTGVQDKNKKDLYEGDIVKSNTNGKLYEIRRLNNHFYCGFVPRAIDGSNENLSFEHEFVIVGNIYENPDLLSNNSK